MLPIIVALVLVIRVRLEISENKLHLNNKSINSFVGVCSVCINKSDLKSSAHLGELYYDLHIDLYQLNIYN